MPLNNNLYGVYKTLKIGGVSYIVESASRNRSMEVSPKSYVQGTPLSAILDIGGVKEDISIQAPILVGGASAHDGRTLANTKITEILSPSTATLPLLQNANFRVSESGASVSMSLMSDGSAASSLAGYFQLVNSPIPALSPVSAGGPTRVARFYDFRVNIGGRTFFVIEANIEVKSNVDTKYFLVPNATSTNIMDETGQGELVTIPNTGGTQYSFGNQFPFIGITGVEISGGGKAAVLLQDLNSDGDFTDFTSGTSDESINLTYGVNEPSSGDLTLQIPGGAVYESVAFSFEIYNPTTDAWVSLLPSLNLTRSVINKSNFEITNGLLTVDFGFTCWVTTA